MTNQKPDLFRKESLERLSSPERLDQLMKVIKPKSWISLATLGTLAGIALTWSIFGSIPVTVGGRGVTIYPSKVIPLQAKSAGQLLAVNIKEGDIVKKGDVLATVDQEDLRKQLQLARGKLAQLKDQEGNANLLQTKRNNQDLKSLDKQRQSLENNLQTVQSLAPVLKDKGVRSLQRERVNLTRRLKVTNEMLPNYKKRWESRKKLFAVGAVADDTVLQARKEYLDSLASIDEAESQLKQIDVKEADALKQYLSNLNEMRSIQSQLQELNSKKATQDQQDLESSTNRKKEIQEVEREINKLEEQLASNGKIISQHSGRILEITINPGQVLEAGARIANIDIENLDSKMVAITYFPVEDGKKIQPDMTIQVTPQTVKRERFGGVVGRVTKVSQFPISKEAASKVVGNSEMVAGLISDKQQGVIEVVSTLNTDPNTFSGYQWSSSAGPKMKISPGTTSTARVKVEDRAPITFVLPILRSASGIY
jgi:HlyD family secretion protein